MDHMEVGNMLACLENNFNTNRGQKTTLRRDATGTVKINQKSSLLHGSFIIPRSMNT